MSYDNKINKIKSDTIEEGVKNDNTNFVDTNKTPEKNTLKTYESDENFINPNMASIYNT